MFEFEGDTFNAVAVAAITREDSKVYIYTYGGGEGGEFGYEFPSIADASRKQKEAVAAWKAAIA